MNALVSILVPIYNVEKYIDRCVRSLFEQTYGNIEYVFIDDCSLDNSMNILIFFGQFLLGKHTGNKCACGMFGFFSV